jgi:carbamoyltransferase
LNFYFEPIADDSGTSIGGAMLAYRVLTKDVAKFPLTSTNFHGNEYYVDDNLGKKCSIDDVVSLLIDQKSVAIFKGKAEAGPRALGNRSILFDARNPQAKRIINKIKNREWYRPFAAMVLKEDASIYFNMIGLSESKYMTISFDATEFAKQTIPGVIHVDNTSRIQTVDKNDGLIYDLLLKFKEQTGVGVLLNTSFNLAGNPLVENIDDAIETLDNSQLDFVWFADQNILREKNDKS